MFKNAIIETFEPINKIDEPIVYNKITINDIKNINKIIDIFKTKLYDKLRYSSKEKHGGGKNNRKPLIRSARTNSFKLLRSLRELRSSVAHLHLTVPARSKPTKYIKKRNSRSSRKRSRNFTKKHNSRSSRKRSKNFTKKNTH